MKETLESIMIYGSLIGVAGVLVYALSGVAGTPQMHGYAAFSPPEKEDAILAFQERYPPVDSGSMRTGDVAVRLTPLQTKGMIRLEISANTHSVDLRQFDLKRITTLEYEGKVIAPVSAPELQGHHAKGEIAFDAEADQFTVRIKGIPNVEERVFEWR